MNQQYRIPLNKPGICGNELLYIAEAILGGHSAGDGPFTKRAQNLLAELLGAQKVLLTTSCTDALEMAALLLDIGPGDEVIVPSFTFVSTINAFVLRGAIPVFVDVQEDTLNLDPSKLREAITSRTKLIVAVHYAGVGCEMDEICPIAQEYGIPLVEDNAHGLLATYKGKMLGTFGSLATLSFHETKNIICGEGGALIINDPRYIERAEILREKGTNRSRFFRGQVDKYTWVDIGSSFLPSDILAAFLYAQLERRNEIIAKRRKVWCRYYEALSPWAIKSGVRLPFTPSYCEHPSHMFYLLFPTPQARHNCIEHLKERYIMSAFHYLPLHLSDMGQKFGGKEGSCPVTESVSDRLLRLPLYNDLSPAEQDQVIAAVCEFSV